MLLRTSLSSFRLTLLSALGVLPVAGCAFPESGSDGPTYTPVCTPAPGGARDDAGYEYCLEGFSHRPEQKGCVDLAAVACRGGNPDASTCATDADCGGGGRCAQDPADQSGRCGCFVGCNADAECGKGELCTCGAGNLGELVGPFGTCFAPLPGPCLSDVDCGPGGICASHAYGGCYGEAYACLTGQDRCRSDADCGSEGRCGHDGSRRVCIDKDRGGCPVPGRPFWVEGAMRVAPLAARDDWASAVAGAGPAGLSEGQRAALGAYWSYAGQMEHASVAAFARFALQLLALGAPPALVGGAIAAQSDELEHARQCFGLASWLGGTPVGPGPLSLAGALEAVTLEEAVRLAVREGCVGETLAALEASEAYERAVEGPVRAVLGRVRVDEGRHAELAWRFVGWAIEAGGTALREAAAEAFLEALEAPFGAGAAAPPPAEGSEAAADEAAGEAFGLLPERVRAELRRRALCDVIGPCAELLLAEGAPSAAAQGTSSWVEALRPPLRAGRAGSRRYDRRSGQVELGRGVTTAAQGRSSWVEALRQTGSQVGPLGLVSL